MKDNTKYFPLASDIADMDITYDFHAHADYTDGKSSVKEMIDKAEELGFTVFSFTEHVRTTADAWWKDYVAEIKKEREGRGITVLIGLEANAIGEYGNVDITPSMVEDAELALGAVHGYYTADWTKIKDGSMPADEALAYEIDKACGLCENEFIDVIAHPGQTYEKFYDHFSEEGYRTIFQKAKDTNTAIEISGNYPKDTKMFLKVLLEVNPRVSFGSNAHHASEIKNMHTYIKNIMHTL